MVLPEELESAGRGIYGLASERCELLFSVETLSEANYTWSCHKGQTNVNFCVCGTDVAFVFSKLCYQVE